MSGLLHFRLSSLRHKKKKELRKLNRASKNCGKPSSMPTGALREFQKREGRGQKEYLKKYWSKPFQSLLPNVYFPKYVHTHIHTHTHNFINKYTLICFLKWEKKHMLTGESDPALWFPIHHHELCAKLFYSGESNYNDNIYGLSMWEKKIMQNFHVYVISLCS